MSRGAPARVTLKKNLARAIAGGQPWIWRDAIAGVPKLPDGAAVTIENAARRPLARGFWDARSPIAVRVVAEAGKADLAEIVAARVDDALVRRLALIDSAQTDTFRWIHGEADRIPG